MRKIVFLNDAINELNAYKFSQPKLVFKVFELIVSETEIFIFSCKSHYGQF